MRRLGRERRQAFVAGLDPAERGRLEQQLADVLKPLLDKSRVLGGYAPLPTEISPLPALEAAAAQGTILAFPAFSDHQSAFRFRAGDPTETGPWAILQPALDAPHVNPDLVLLPLVAVDRKGTRLGQGKGHYDRAASDLRKQGGMLIGVGWAVQMLDEEIPADAWDLPLDGFASPEGLRMFR
ncbi:5-formyltetrahydrofolate cyclo-ligase [Sphingomonas alba]|uniref:5-formyltetrahydrofolate cyclo-ligase n=1 Tax=Sphingomonas alba TaxID=2908208 RepID=A0ABT0RJN7_9SPHN|nr:5-formyltetrahydrofolate cyclo-ligase [Sphingomonas alba]MCL6682832.1 5-formyltetrahydrofolate cyclo-ligase [Sphingomonas alba]